jgi:RNA polymerase sigma-70 factor (ECF subfamily)
MMAALPKVRRVAFKLTRTREAADDLVQDVVEKALKNRESFQLGTNMAAWLCFIARNHFYSLCRRSRRQTELTEDMERGLIYEAGAHHKLELKEALDALQYLPDEQREAFLLVVVEGEEYEDAAQKLGAEVGTIKSRVSRARDAIDAFFAAA